MGDDSPKENALITDVRDPDTPTYEPEAKKIKVDSDVDRLADDEEDCKTDALTPSRKTRTPKISKEDREAERQKKLEMRRQREEERERAKAEKERIAEEKRLEKEKKEKEKEEKRKEEERKKAEKEEKRKEEERKKEEKRKEEERKKAELIKEREEKKEAKRKEEEEKLKKKEEQALKKKEEEDQKRKEEEAEAQKKKRESARFIGFFKKVTKDTPPPEKVENQELWYRPFPMKSGMVMAPVLRREPLKADDEILTQDDQITKISYLSSEAVKKKKLVGCRKIELKAKLFQFHDNYRPPYYGTIRKFDKNIKGRAPCKPSSDNIDYENDSDAEWEDEPSDAEECRSDEEDPDEVEEVDSDAGEFCVEHGYLSDGEGQDDDEAEDGETGRDAEGRAERLAARATEWKRNVLNKPQLKIPVCVGPSFAPLPQLLATPAVVIP